MENDRLLVIALFSIAVLYVVYDTRPEAAPAQSFESAPNPSPAAAAGASFGGVSAAAVHSSPPPPAAPAVAPALPTSDWEVVPATGGAAEYYWNTVTDAVVWDKPAELIAFEAKLKALNAPQTTAAPAPSAPEPVWEAVTDPASGDTYYWNTQTEAVSWTKPDDFDGTPTASAADAPSASSSPAPAAPTEIDPAAAAHEWHELSDPHTGEVYYWNTRAGTTQWTPPPAGVTAWKNPTPPDSHARDVLSGKTPVWHRINDAVSGRHYYWHRLTGHTTFQAPGKHEVVGTTPLSAPAGAASGPHAWYERFDLVSRRPYYWNRASGVTSWDKPTNSGDSDSITIIRDAAPESHCAKQKPSDAPKPKSPPFPHDATLRVVSDVYAEAARERVHSVAECRAPALSLLHEQSITRYEPSAFPFVGTLKGEHKRVCSFLNPLLWLECAPAAASNSPALAEPYSRRVYIANARDAFVDYASTHPDAPGTVFDATRAFHTSSSVRSPRVTYPKPAPGSAERVEPRVVHYERLASVLQVYPTSEAHFRAETLPKLLWLHSVLPASVPIVAAVDGANVAYMEYLYTKTNVLPRNRVIRHSSASVYSAGELYFAGEWPPVPARRTPYAGSHTTSYPAQHMERVRRAFVGPATPDLPLAERKTIVVVTQTDRVLRTSSGAGVTALVKALTDAFPGYTVREFVASSAAGGIGFGDAAISGLAGGVAAIASAIDVFRRAAVVISAHGSALTNIMYCAPKTTIVEIGFASIEHSPPLDSMYYRMSAGLGLDYWLVLGSSTGDGNANAAPATYASNELWIQPAAIVDLLRSGGQRNGRPAKPTFA